MSWHLRLTGTVMGVRQELRTWGATSGNPHISRARAYLLSELEDYHHDDGVQVDASGPEGGESAPVAVKIGPIRILGVTRA